MFRQKKMSMLAVSAALLFGFGGCKAGTLLEYALFKASEWGCHRLVKPLFQRLNVSSKVVFTTARRHKATALTVAASKGHVAVVRLLKKREEDSAGHVELAFMYAAKYGHCEVLRELLDDNTVDIDSKLLGKTALSMAANAGDTNAVRFLLDQGAHASSLDVLYAAHRGDKGMVELLAGAGVMPTDEEIEQGGSDILKAELKAGVQQHTNIPAQFIHDLQAGQITIPSSESAKELIRRSSPLYEKNFVSSQKALDKAFSDSGVSEDSQFSVMSYIYGEWVNKPGTREHIKEAARKRSWLFYDGKELDLE